MEVSNVQLVTVRANEVFAHLYEFSGRSWVGFGEERGKRHFGPASLLELKTTRITTTDVDIIETEFPPVQLAEIDGHLLYRDEWTILPHSLFILVLPPRCVAKDLLVNFEGEEFRFMKSVDGGGSLYYYGTFSNRNPAVLRIEAEIIQDDADYMRVRGELGPSTVSPAALFRRTIGQKLANLANPQTWISFADLIHNLHS